MPASLSPKVQVMVELDAPPASALYAEALQVAQANAPRGQQASRVPMSAAQKGQVPRVEIDSASAARVANHASALDAAQQALLPSIANTGAEVIYRTQSAYNGIAVSVSPDRLADLAKMPGVKAVHAMIPKYPTAFTDIDFLGVRAFWNKPNPQGVGLHGEGVKIAVIDSGVDYTHANFGGPGQPNYAGITDTSPVPNAYFPSAKFPFGTDLCGDAYTGSNTPKPDPNPLDSNEHGTSCASLAAGYGENAGGTTYRGNYDNTTNIAALKISPGMAPLAQIVPIRVFGTSGSTNLVTQAIDYAMDPNHDGNFSDHVDIISMSLGADVGTEDDPDAVAVSNAASVGILVASASGNAGDTFYNTSSPGSGRGGISVAASFNDQAGFISDAQVKVNNTAAAGSRAKALYGSPSPHVSGNGPDQGGLTGTVVEARPRTLASGSNGVNPTNCNQMNGKIVLVDRGGTSFVDKSSRIQSCGGIGVVISNQNNPGADPIIAALDASITIPVVMISQVDADNFRGVAQFDPTTGVSAVGANVTIYNDNQITQRNGVSADTMPTYSSRGPLQGSNALKPDLTAPAEVVGTANTGTGTDVRLFNGTSSATPHVSGCLALMRELHPTWSVEEIMALAMNTATHDLFTESGTAGSSPPTSQRRGVSRVGAGRIDMNSASSSDVIIFNATDPGRVSVSFGDVEVPVDGSVAISKQVTIRNKGTTDIRYNASIQMVNTDGDSNFSAPSSQVIAQAGKDVTFPLLFRATGSTLKHFFSGDLATTQVGISRQYLTEAAGYGVLTQCTPQNNGTCTPTNPATAPQIRIPLYAAPKPVSSMRTQEAGTGINPGGTNTSTFNVTLTGRPVNTGNSTPIDIISLVKPFECQYVSPGVNTPGFSGDPNVIKYVGVTSDYNTVAAGSKQNSVLTFAVGGFGDQTVPSYVSSDKEIFIDVNFDGVEDFVIYFDSRRDASFSNAHTNVYTPTLVNLNTGAATALGFFTNVYGGTSLDTNSFNNDFLIASVRSSALGYTGAGQSFFQYYVATFNRNGDFVDSTPFMRYDIAKPGLDSTGAQGATEPFMDVDAPGTIPVAYNGANFQANGSKGLLMVHRHNAAGNRGELVPILTPHISNFSPKQGSAGTAVTINGSNFGPGMSVKFSPNVPAAQVNVLSANTISCRVPAGAVTGPITVSSSAGSDTSNEDFTVVPAASPSPSPSPTVSPTGRVTARLRNTVQ